MHQHIALEASLVIKGLGHSPTPGHTCAYYVLLESYDRINQWGTSLWKDVEDIGYAEQLGIILW